MSEIEAMKRRIEAIEQQQEIVYELSQFLSDDGEIFLTKAGRYLQDAIRISLTDQARAMFTDSVKDRLLREEAKLREMIAGLTAPL